MNDISHQQAIQSIHQRLDGMLQGNQELLLDEHLHTCEPCRKYSNEMELLPTHLHHEFHTRWDQNEGPSKNMTAQIEKQNQRVIVSNRISFGFKAVASVVAIMLVGLVINTVVSQMRDQAITLSETSNGSESVSSQTDGRLLAFTMEENGNLDIYTMRSDGSELKKLTNNPALDVSPVWSPDGRQIAFESDRNGFRQIFLMNADGSNVVQLIPDKEDEEDQEENQDPKGDQWIGEPYNLGLNLWSPDGKKLVFLEMSPGNDNGVLYVIDANGENKKPLVEEPGTYSSPSWSPDGKHIVFLSLENSVYRIYSTDVDGNNITNVTKKLELNETLYPVRYSWSRDGQSISFIASNWNYLLGGPIDSPDHKWTAYEASLDGNTLITNATTGSQIGGYWDGSYFLSSSTTLSVSPEFTWVRSDGTSTTTNPIENCQSLNDNTGFSTYKQSSNGNVVIGAYCPNGDKWLFWANSEGTFKPLLNSPIQGVSDINAMHLWAPPDFIWSSDDKYIAFNVFSLGKTNMYIVNATDALNDPSIQLFHMNIGNGFLYYTPSWQPILNSEAVEEKTTSESIKNLSANRLVAFTSIQDENHEIYTIHADGTEMTNLTNDPGDDTGPYWSPDGKRIAFQSNRTGLWQIYVMDADGSNLIQLTKNNANHTLPLTMDFKADPWSPDGTTMLVLKQESGEDQWSLHSISLDGAKETQLVTGRIAQIGISWSPDGNYVGYVQNESQSDDPNDFAGKLYVVRADGNNPQDITDVFEPNEQLLASLYSWSADGQSISLVSYWRQQHIDETKVYEVRLDDHSVTDKYVTNSILNNWQDEMTHAVMAESSLLSNWVRSDGTSRALDPFEHCKPTELGEAYINRSALGNWTIIGRCSHGDHWLYWENADGTTIKQLIDSPLSAKAEMFISFAWSPEDRYIAFNLVSPDKTIMYILDVNAALNDPSIQPAQVRIADSEFYTAPAWQPISNREVVDEEPTPDPTETLSSEGLLAFVSQENDNSEIYTMRADGSGLTNLTNDPAYDSLPYWSPEGRKIAFTSDRDGSNQIYMMDVDGSNVTQITNGDGDYGLDLNGFNPWSPDGTSLLIFQRAPEGQGSQVYAIDVDQRSMTLLTTEAGNYSSASWSADGTHVAFTMDTQRAAQELFIVGSDGNGLVRLTENLPAGESFMFEYNWAENGSSLFFMTSKNRQVYQGASYISTVYKANPDGSTEVVAQSIDGQILDWWRDTYVRMLSTEKEWSWELINGSQSKLKFCENNGQMTGMAHKRSNAGNWIIGANCSPDGWMLSWANTDGTVVQPLPDLDIPVEDDILFEMEWSSDDQYIAFISFSSKPVDPTATLYVLDVAQAREDPSTQPLKIAGGSNPSWQPISKSEVVEENPTPEPTPEIESKILLQIGTNISNGEWIAFIGGKTIPDPVNSTALTTEQDVFLIHPDGSGLTNVTQSPAYYFNLQWSPNGQNLLFLRESLISDKISFIRIYDGSIGGGGDFARPISDPDMYGYSWSPRSDKIVFADASNGNYDIYTVYADGRNDPKLTQLTDDPAQDVGFVWSPDGSQIAFQRLDGDTLSIYVMNEDGSNQQEVARGMGKVKLRWSMDGQSLYANSTYLWGDTKYSHLECEGCVVKPAVYQIDLNGPSIQQIYFQEDSNRGFYVYDTPQNKLYFLSVVERDASVGLWGTWRYWDGNSVHEVGELDPHQTCLTTTGGILNEHISPDHRYSIISNYCAGGFDLYLADREASDPDKRLTHLLRLPLGIWGQGGDGATIPMTWSPDGRSVIYDNGNGSMLLLDLEKVMQGSNTEPVPLIQPILFEGQSGQLFQSPETISVFDLVWQPNP